jgi:murein L,D-transpeptidase YafK
LIEKDKEIVELKRMLSAKESEIEAIKREVAEIIKSEISDELIKLKELESTIIELKKIVESLTSEILYIKTELKRPEKKFEVSESKEEKRQRGDRRKTEAQHTPGTDEAPIEKDSEDDNDIIICD